ncbi:MAG: glycine zipper domain-containing protein [Verrucomicrobiota bacterium]|nr:glycine zipper domain-containing protein [Verrucomicrobiota bacterium]
MKKKFGQNGLVVVLGLALTGCSNLPGSDKQQGAVIGGATGAAVGAAVTKNRALGAVIGGAVGAAGGYVIGSNSDKLLGRDKEEVQAANRKSQEAPATTQDVNNATTADLNSDGFVTLDEVVAMEKAGLTDEVMLQRLRATGQVFQLTEEQNKYLREQGISQEVISELATMNQEKKMEVLEKPTDQVIGRPIEPETKPINQNPIPNSLR